MKTGKKQQKTIKKQHKTRLFNYENKKVVLRADTAFGI
jgi:hypothetical protein